MRWLHGDLHTHTTFSDGLHSIEEAVAIAKAVGLDFIALTDHNTFDQNKVSHDFTLIPGVELTTPRGHCNFIGIDAPFEITSFITKEAIQKAFVGGNASNAFISINHPFVGDKWEWGFEDFTFDAIEIWNGSPYDRNKEAIAWWQEQLCLGKKIIATGGSDVHKHGMKGRYYGEGHTLVWAQENSPYHIYQGLKEGKVCVASHPESSCAFFQINGYNIGESILFSEQNPRPESLKIAIELHLKRDSLLRIIGDKGVVIEQTINHTTKNKVVMVPASSCFYRLEVWHLDDVASLTQPFFTNPIYILEEDACQLTERKKMKHYLDHILASTEKAAERFLKIQVKDATRKDFGGTKETLLDVKPTVYQIMNVISVYLYKGSRYYKDDTLIAPIKHAYDFVERELRPDGTLDYPSCNFASAPDTSFCLKQIIPAYQLFLKYTNEDELVELKEQLRRIIRRALIGVKKGGFHTPNHRWAICAALMQGYEMFKGEPISDEFKTRADQYLAEGIDGNEDGEYAERSTGGYNAVVNTALITLYEVTKDVTYLQYVKRNLEMMLYYFEPDKTIFTQNSTRQDKGSHQYGYQYFYQCLYIAENENNLLMDGAAHQLISDNVYRHDQSPLCLYKLMLNERLLAYTFKSKGFPEEYKKFFKNSGVVRYKKGDFSYSLLKDKKKFLFLQWKDITAFVRIGISYCDIRSFVPQKITEIANGYELEFEGKGWYYLPFEEDQGTTDWWQMDHSKRELLINTTLNVKVRLYECETGVDLEVETTGSDKIPVRFEVAVPGSGLIETGDTLFKGVAGEQMILKKGDLDAKFGDLCCHIRSGFAEHEYTGHYSGEEKNEQEFTVIMTDYSPVSRKVHIGFSSVE